MHLSLPSRFGGLSTPVLALSPIQCTENASNTSNTSGLTRQDFVRQYCQLAASCCAASAVSGGDCETNVGLAVPSKLDPGRGQECLDGIKARSGDEHFCSNGVDLIAASMRVPACSALGGSGTVPVGGEYKDAVTGVECAPSPQGHVACVFGKGKQLCQIQRLGADGEISVGDSNDNGTLSFGASIDSETEETGTYCDRSKGLHCIAGKCTRQVAVGAACVNDVGCTADAYCAFDTRVCTTLAADGMTCGGGHECASRSCDAETKKWTSIAHRSVLEHVCGSGGR
jgi:hypothetical protein